jgi:hypothetical protein
MQDRRQNDRFAISFPVRVKWKDDGGKPVSEDGLTENIGANSALIYLPRLLPTVGSKIDLTITENPKDEVSVTATVIRLERNAAHPQMAVSLTDGIRTWKKKVWEHAGATIAAEKPDEFDEW